MTARFDLEAVLQHAGVIPCPTCTGPMLTKLDAIGRSYQRCPRCDRVAPPTRVHPDEALVPQTLVKVNAGLPAIAPGQLRCQRCAKGVSGNARFCVACTAAKAEAATRQPGAIYRDKPCSRCGNLFTPRGPNAKRCEACR